MLKRRRYFYKDSTRSDVQGISKSGVVFDRYTYSICIWLRIRYTVGYRMKFTNIPVTNENAIT